MYLYFLLYYMYITCSIKIQCQRVKVSFLQHDTTLCWFSKKQNGCFSKQAHSQVCFCLWVMDPANQDNNINFPILSPLIQSFIRVVSSIFVTDRKLQVRAGSWGTTSCWYDLIESEAPGVMWVQLLTSSDRISRLTDGVQWRHLVTLPHSPLLFTFSGHCAQTLSVPNITLCY